MRIQRIYINLPPPIIHLGKVGEQNYVKFEFDVSPWKGEYQDGEISVHFLRHDLKTGYPVDTSISGDIVSWQPSLTDLSASGEGKLQLWITSGETVGSSVSIKTQTDPSLSSIGDRPPPPPPDWALEVLEAKKVSERAETNSKASEEAAGRSAAAAGASETNAQRSETNTSASEESAKISEDNAGASERNAKASEEATKVSETNAKGSEDRSKASEINAKASEDKSKVSEINSAESELVAAQALLDLLAMLGTQVATLDVNGKLTAGQLPPIDAALSDTSENAVQNKVVKAALDAQSTSISALDAEVSLDATNLITNGDFSNGTTGWTKVSCTATAASNEATVLTSAQYGRLRSVLTPVSNNVYYVCANIKATSSLVKLVFNSRSGYDTIVKAHSGSGNYERISAVGTMPVTTDATGGVSILDYRASGWDNIYVKYVMAINLTAIFGAGNEPTAAEMDNLLSYYPNSWFNGTKNLAASPYMLKYLLQQVRNINTEKTSYGVVGASNLLVAAQSTPDMTVKVPTGIIYMDTGRRFTPTAVAAQSIITADAMNPRIDIVYVNSSGVIAYLAGTAGATPSAPSVPTGGQKLAEISVAANATTIVTANIVDRRKTLTGEAWIKPTLINSWTEYSVSYPVGYYKDSSGIVHLHGLINGGTYNTIAFNLPAGYRALNTYSFFGVSTGGATILRASISSDGSFNAVNSAYTNWVSLDGISFRAEA